MGTLLGRRHGATPPIARLLADGAHRAGAAGAAARDACCSTACGRCWSAPSVAGALAFLAPQIPAVAAGFAIIWALAWRRQESAVAAIEERDGVRFYIERTSPVSPIKLVRTPGFGGSFLNVNGAGT